MAIRRDDSTGTPEQASHGTTLRDHLRVFRIAAWLGWQVESNWAEPIVFFIFAILRPVSTALILLLMYTVIAGPARGAFFDYLYISNALYIIVMQSIANMSWTVFDDREGYRMLKYVFTSPVSMRTYLLGRGVARSVIGLTTCLLLLVAGGLFLGVHLSLASIDWSWLALYFLLGMVILLSMGLILAGLALVLARNGEFMGEIVAGMLLLVSSVYFPPDILPGFLRIVSLGMPVTYWLEAMRRALSPPMLATTHAAAPISAILSTYSNGEIATVLLLSAIASALLAFFVYGRLEHLAQSRGMIDRVSGY